jgi:hypothetical protein
MGEEIGNLTRPFFLASVKWTKLSLERRNDMAVPTNFNNLIRPYFTPCYRAHMIAFGPRIDLWDYDVVKANWQIIFDAVEAENMPRQGCGEGIWDSTTRTQFLTDFQAWKDAGFPQEV